MKNPIGLTLLIFIFLSCKTQKAEEETKEPVRIAVTITQPSSKGFIDYIQLNGNTQFQKKLGVRATITGYLTAMKWKVGDNVTSGTEFCTIKTKEQAALNKIDNQDASLQKFQTPLKVMTSAAGFITAVNFIEGDFVNEGDVIATLTEPSSLVLIVNVPYEYHQYVYVGRTCEVRLPDGKIINSAITQIIPVVDANTQTQQFLIRLPNQKLPENMNLLVRIPMKQKQNALALPLEAIQTNETQDEFWVMKLVNDSLAVRVPITVGLQNDSLKEITSGALKMSDKIIVKGAYGMVDSSLVKVGN